MNDRALERLSDSLYELTRHIAEQTDAYVAGGLLGGEFGYGAEYENDVFMMHPFCWCEREDCPWCSDIGATPQLIREVCGLSYAESDRAPNFLFKPSGFKVWWYKYIGRGMETKGSIPKGWLETCRASVGVHHEVPE